MFQFDNLADFMTMDGHGIYVWVSYFVTLVVMAWLVAWPILASRETRRALRRGAVRQERFVRRGVDEVEEPRG